MKIKKYDMISGFEENLLKLNQKLKRISDSIKFCIHSFIIMYLL